MEPGQTRIAPAPLLCSYRLLLALVGCLALINLYAMRININVAMECMVNHGNHTHLSDGEYAWPFKMQGVMLGAFFWGYMLTQVLGGVMADRWGGKHVLGWSMFLTMAATFFIPLGATVSPYMVVALRIITGLGEGTVFPAMITIWAKWAPPLERSKLIGFTFAGAQIGNVLTLSVSGLLCDYGFAGGWPSIFYVCGMVCFVWFVLWMVLVADTPGQHRSISYTEKHYIQTSIGHSASDHNKAHAPTPWKSIFSSPAVWAIIAAHLCANWGTYTMLIIIPNYMRDVFAFDIKHNVALSALPYVALWAFINIGGNVADALRTRGWKTVTVRKMSACAGMVLPALFIIITGSSSSSSWSTSYVAVALLTIGIGLSGFQYSGQMVNHVDIAPPFAGTLFGISNTCATLPGILAPYVVDILTPNRFRAEWLVVLYITAAVYTVGAIIYVIFAAGETQDWAKPFMVDSGKKEMATVKVHPKETKDLLSI